IEVEAVGAVEGKSLLHLQCHFGQDSLSWARRGARVTGVDFSPAAVAAARQMAEELDLTAEFVESDVLALDLARRFDIVFTSYGVLGWLPDLEGWAKVVARHLAAGGLFCLVEFHPALMMLDFDTGQLAYEYFHQSYQETVSDSYAGQLGPREEHFWSHSLEDVLGPLLAHLRLERFREFDYSPYGCFGGMQEQEPGRWRYPAPVRLPHLFSLHTNLLHFDS
ncbi:MAG: class I SAM-dependent methyltransferase, partial [Candidatus Eremiobacteraeota bacterium]|nr:class I SAM-dependent methyltransferase [Candidatus Eremiobacteraeota bacterium]